ncbi:hypothetical protein NLJ89_g4537 [Agrocybe chaxingu]|uniref:GH16 domain-containing protein n=1 Tax=Agrocybe chaxingu TaxID=84603 RepID=A0A9W8K2W3_9AGAR|nr:hypothetical protein NLJ89_g4537 [Agrocybe chaxingu]
MPVPPLPAAGDEKLAPPHPKFTIAGGSASDPEQDRNGISHHSRTTSLESHQVTHRSLTFNNPPTSFSFNNQAFYTPDQTPGTTPSVQPITGNGYPFPDASSDTPRTPRSGIDSVSTSVADFSGISFGSRPGTSDNGSSLRPTSGRSREAFASPKARPMTIYSTVVPSSVKVERERPKSTMLTASTTLQKPWMSTRDPLQRLSYFITYAFMFLGICLGAVRIFFGWRDVKLLQGNMCVVMDENFDSDVGLFGENGKFFREVEMGGFGNGQFEMATASQNNSYIRNGRLYITPTLTSDNIGESAIIDGTVYNITGCTYNITQGISYTSTMPHLPKNASAIASDQPFDVEAYTKACSAVSNATSGQIINPIQSARLTTRKTASIKYGRVEVRAKIPTGDWLWPAIWMMPVDSKYGPWPMSGEIDIMESRGNGPEYPKQGNNYVRGSLNWGPLTWLNGVSKTYGWWTLRRGSYDQDFHTYALEWDKDFMRIYVDSRLHHMLDLRMNKPFFELGDFPHVVQNGSEAVILNNPWINGTTAAPFDQPFFLILNVAVGGTNGWFPDGNEKPWLDGSNTAMGDFWRNRDKWLPTWPTNPEDRSLVVDSIKMWQQC